MKKNFTFALLLFLLGVSLDSCKQESTPIVSTTLTQAELLDKIKGGWAGQTIGVAFGSHTEFKHQGTFIQDYQRILWHKGYVKELMDSWPDLFDDIYMKLLGGSYGY